MYLVLIVAAVVCAALVVAFVLLFRRLAVPGVDIAATLEWARDLSVSRYKPMERLLDENDYGFLACQPGYSRQLAARLRRERRKIFRAYLRSMSRDFGRICTAVQMLMVQSQEDRPDLAAILIRQRAFFALALMAVHVRLVLHSCGWGTVDVSGLVGSLEAMRMQIRQMLAIPAMDLA